MTMSSLYTIVTVLELIMPLNYVAICFKVKNSHKESMANWRVYVVVRLSSSLGSSSFGSIISGAYIIMTLHVIVALTDNAASLAKGSLRM